jgi:hypothetical protein
MEEREEIKNILKISIKIVNDLADIDIDNIDQDMLQKLIKRSITLKKNKFWRLN